MQMRRFKRFGWAFGDQAIASISNLLLSVLLARQLGINEFGAFGLAYAGYQIMIGVSRSTVGEPTLIRSSGTHPDHDAKARARAATLGASLALGVASGLVFALIALFVPPSIAPAFWALSVSLPGLMLLDGMRYWAFASNQPRTAVFLDAGWLTIQLILYFAFISIGFDTLFGLMISWGGGALGAACLYLLLNRSLPSLKGALNWFRSNMDMSSRFLGEYLTVSGVQQGMVLFTLIFGGLAAVGSLRAGQVIMGPMNVVTMGVAVVVLPFLSRRASTAPQTLLRSSILVSSTLSFLMLSFGALTLLVPTSLGTAVLGESWSTGQQLAPLVAGTLAVTSLSYGATSALRAMQKVKESFRLRLITAPLVLSTIGVGAALGGVSGALIGAISGGFLQAIAWWHLYVTQLRKKLNEDGTKDD
jgi:O-antigen/teichoic acid export membrane protein